MTYFAPDVLPYDKWFDNEVSYDPDVGEYLPELGEPPHPHDSMPIATDNPRPEEEIADDLTMHEKMYRIATAKYNPFSVGGSESIHDFE